MVTLVERLNKLCLNINSHFPFRAVSFGGDKKKREGENVEHEGIIMGLIKGKAC